jgi:lipoprotein-anchoring transpeptidase ErfK/SrfK
MPPRHNPRPRSPQPRAAAQPVYSAQQPMPAPPMHPYPAANGQPPHAPQMQQTLVQQPMPTVKNLPPRPAAKPKRRAWWLIPLIGMVGFFGVLLVGVLVAVTALYSGGILPNVSAAGVDLGGMSVEEASAALQTQWTSLTLTDTTTGEVWEIEPQQLGITLDANATANRAYEQGRSDGSALVALRGVDVAPVLMIDSQVARDGLEALRTELDKPAQNAGVEVVNGEVRAKAPQSGRMLDVTTTLALLEKNSGALADGRFEIIRNTTQPEVTDASALVETARQLLAQPLNIRVFDPVTGDIIQWDAAPEIWATWLTATAEADSPTGLALAVNHEQVGAYLDENANVLDSTRYLDNDNAITAIEQAVQRGDLQATLRVYHHDREHVVQSGETIISIAWDYGVPYPWIQQANPGVDALSVGQTLTIPSQDNFFQYDPVPDKRIVVSISQQKAWVYENGAVKWEWGVSTGINNSPTWPGVYQIISHEPNAYAANWDLYMPNFMGVYQPIPGQDFTNGFHGFPTRGGGQLLWENSIGTKVTYGCILLNNTNIQLLYDWAPEGVVVEIQA